MGVYISNMSKPKSCWECVKKLDIECCGDIRDCPLIEIDDTVWENEKYKLIRMTQAVRINKAMAERRADEDGDRVVETASDRA